MTAFVERPEFQKDLDDQVIWFQARDGRPSATPSVGTYTKSGTTLSSSADTNVTLDPVNTTLAAAASVGDTELQLTSVSDLRVGATYLLTNIAGQSEWVRIKTKTNNVQIDSGLENAYPITTSTFVSTEFYYTLQTEDIDTFRDQNIARATYAVSGYVPTFLERVFDVCYRPLKNPLTVERIKNRWPGIMRQDTPERAGEAFESQRDEAWEIVRVNLRQHGFTPAHIVDAGNIYEWALQEFALLLQESGKSIISGIGKLDALDRLQAKRDRAFEAAIRTIEWADTNDDRVQGGDEEHRPMRLRFTR